MTRAEFEDFIARYVWRDGDTVLAADVQYLIRLGEARLSRDLKVQRRIKRDQIVDAADYRLVLPADFHSVHVLHDGDCAYTYISPWDLAMKRGQGAGHGHYTITDTIEIGDDASYPKTLDLTYYSTLPVYSDAETWVQQHYFDLYLHACLIHASTFLREDDRVGQWEGFYDKNLASVITEDAYRKYDGSPLKQRLPGIVA